jgi:hypothetical protein
MRFRRAVGIAKARWVMRCLAIASRVAAALALFEAVAQEDVAAYDDWMDEQASA